VSEGSEVTYEKGLTPRIMVISLIVLLGGYVLAKFNWDFSTRQWTYCGLWISYFWVGLLIEALGRINPRWRLTAAETMILWIPFWLLTGVSFWEKGAANEGVVEPYGTWSTLVYALMNEPYASAWKDFFPSFWVPSDLNIVRIMWSGLMPGETVPWGPWIAPLIYWSLFRICLVTVCLCTLYILRRPLIEVERLPFVPSVPFAYFTRQLCTVEDNKSRLFNFRDAWSKVFWIGFFVGAIVGLQPILTEVIPIIPMAAFWGEYEIDFSVWTSAILPGAQTDAVLHTTQTALWILLPYDTLITAIITWFVLEVLYNVVIVRMGLVPYSPGVESDWGYFGYRPPFHYCWFAFTGVTIGIAIWTLYAARDHLRRAFRSIVSREVDVRDQGLSLRTVLIIGIVATIILWLQWIVSGDSYSAAFAVIFWLFFIFFVLHQIGCLRMVGEAWYHMPENDELLWPYVYYPGLALGIPEGNNPAMVRAMTLTTMSSFRFLPYNAYMMGCYFRGLEITRTRARDAFIWILVSVIIVTLFGNFYDAYIYAHTGGLSSTTGDHEFADSTAWSISARNLLSSEMFPVAYDFGVHVLYTVVGAAFTIGLYVLRMRFPWFPINPASMVMAMYWTFPWMWFNGLLALAIKVILTKVGGARLIEERAIPAIAGFCTGFGCLEIIGGLYTLFTQALPTFYALYKP